MLSSATTPPDTVLILLTASDTHPMGSAPAASAAPGAEPLVARPVPFASIPRSAWDRLFALSTASTPFSRWTFHRAWWDAYGSTAHEQYLVCVRSDSATEPSVNGTPPRSSQEHPPQADEIRAIVPLMHRHVVEPEDAATATVLRRRATRMGRQVRPDAKAVFFGASYHADYAAVLCAPEDVEAVARAAVAAFARPPDPGHGDREWDIVDLRRLRAEDPMLDALEAAFREVTDACAWDVCREQEDVCPVAVLPGDDWDGYLATLEKKARHEIRRKMRRAEGAGELRFRLVDPDPAAVDSFIELHQARWGDQGLFRPSEGGARSRRFLHRLAELEAAEGPGRQLELGQLEVSGRTVFATVGFDDGETCYFYNAGLDPEARDISPGVTGTAAYIRDRLEAGRRRFDFLRGDEPYKYEWGARDEPIHRLLVQREDR